MGKKDKSKPSGANDEVLQSTTSVHIGWARLLKRTFRANLFSRSLFSTLFMSGLPIPHARFFG
jgi:hypothetical protein